jgi:mxaJ protein
MRDDTVQRRFPKWFRSASHGGRRFALGLATVATLATLLPPKARGDEDRNLRVCADPNNLPFSDSQGRGLENRLARLLAADLGKELKYTYWAQRRGFFRSTLKAHLCDVVMGVPVGLEMVATTSPYYRSSYAFVSRHDRMEPVRSFDDPRLRTLRVGVALIGDDGVNSPPVHALSRRGIVQNLRGYSVLGDYSVPAPLAAPVRAVDGGEVDVAVVWGPVASYFAQHAEHALDVIPVAAGADPLPESYEIALGVRRGDTELRERLNVFLRHRQPEIAAILREYGLDTAGVTRP